MSCSVVYTQEFPRLGVHGGGGGGQPTGSSSIGETTAEAGLWGVIIDPRPSSDGGHKVTNFNKLRLSGKKQVFIFISFHRSKNIP